MKELPRNNEFLEKKDVFKNSCAWCGPVSPDVSAGVCERHEKLMTMRIKLVAVLKKAIHGERLPITIAA